MATSFSNSTYHDSVLKVREFMFGDIDKTLSLVHISSTGAPNFLLALGLCCYTEYWGKLVLGVKKGEINRSKYAFNEFIKRFDKLHYEGLLNNHVDLYGDIRCGLAHSYLIESKGDAEINTGYKVVHGIEYNPKTRKYIFWVRSYFDEFKSAVNKYINGLELGTESLKNLEDSLNNRPELV